MGNPRLLHHHRSFDSLVTSNAYIDVETLFQEVENNHAALIKQQQQQQQQPDDNDETDNHDVACLNWSQLQKISLLGKGGHAKVYLVVDTKTRHQYALKCVDTTRLTTTQEQVDATGELAREAAWLVRFAACQHPNIISIRGVGSSLPTDGPGFFFTMDVLQETLKDRLKRWRKDLTSNAFATRRQKLFSLLPRKNMTERCNVVTNMLDWHSLCGRVETVALGVASAMVHLHEEEQVVLCDLKPANIGFHAMTGTVQLLDFGMARSIQDTAPEACGTPRYMAPEVMLGKGTSFASDVYSFGVVLYELSSLKVPFEQPPPTMTLSPLPRRSHVRKPSGSKLHDLKSQVTNARTRPPLKPSEILCPRLRNLIEDCWEHDPERRPKFVEVEQRLLNILRPEMASE